MVIMASGGADNLVIIWSSKPHSEEFSVYCIYLYLDL